MFVVRVSSVAALAVLLTTVSIADAQMSPTAGSTQTGFMPELGYVIAFWL